MNMCDADDVVEMVGDTKRVLIDRMTETEDIIEYRELNQARQALDDLESLYNAGTESDLVKQIFEEETGLDPDDFDGPWDERLNGVIEA